MGIKCAKTAVVSIDSFIQDDVTIWEYTQVREGVKIGAGTSIGSHCYIDKDVKIGKGCKIQSGCLIYKGVTIADNVFIGPGVKFTNVRNPRAFVDRKDEFLPTYVAIGATIGCGSIIRCGIVICEYAMVGAGAVVTKKVLPNQVVVGVPARQWGFTCMCGSRMTQQDYNKSNSYLLTYCRECPCGGLYI